VYQISPASSASLEFCRRYYKKHFGLFFWTQCATWVIADRSCTLRE